MAALRHILITGGIILGCSLTAAEEAVRLDRNQLLQYRDASGKVQPVTTPLDWQQRRAEILRGMEEVVGKLPGEERRVPLVPLEYDRIVDTLVKDNRLILLLARQGNHVLAESTDLAHWSCRALGPEVEQPLSVECDGNSYWAWPTARCWPRPYLPIDHILRIWKRR